MLICQSTRQTTALKSQHDTVKLILEQQNNSVQNQTRATPTNSHHQKARQQYHKCEHPELNRRNVIRVCIDVDVFWSCCAQL